MVLWIIQDGQKVGPFEDYEVREMIREGAIDEETGVWHEGAEGWVPAKQIEVLAGEFVEPEVVPPPIPITVEQFRPWLRLGARVFDYQLYALLINLVPVFFGVKLDITQDTSGWLVIGLLVPVILMEAAMVSSLGWSPGKGLLGMRVETLLGQRLSTGQALMRTMRVWVVGMGMRIQLILIFGCFLSLWFGLKKGAMLWDIQSGYQVRREPLTKRNLWWFWALMILVIGGNAALLMPDFLVELDEEMKRQGLR